ncbi:MAG: anaphase promoting complex subunit doc1 [Trizodia sp. TS-e1964]|nr:MAG: anaphase promoting complex subunit doc1 [Trizodia sp. TS-e1964]
MPRTRRPPPQQQTPEQHHFESPSNEPSEEAELAGTAVEDEDDYEDIDESEPEMPSQSRFKAQTFDPTGLKEISNLASWTVSTSKPGCGVEALKSEDTSLFWQSDGPQPHLLNIHFFKLVCIVHMRLYLDFENDESYTPTKMTFLAGTGHHDLQEVVEMTFEQPKGWIDIDLSGVGGSEDPATTDDAGADLYAGRTLRCFLVQVRVSENHQNGKDTHVRGLQIYARDKDAAAGRRKSAKPKNSPSKFITKNGLPAVVETGSKDVMIEPDWMGDPVLR